MWAQPPTQLALSAQINHRMKKYRIIKVAKTSKMIWSKINPTPPCSPRVHDRSMQGRDYIYSTNYICIKNIYIIYIAPGNISQVYLRSKAGYIPTSNGPFLSDEDQEQNKLITHLQKTKHICILPPFAKVRALLHPAPWNEHF